MRVPRPAGGFSRQQLSTISTAHRLHPVLIPSPPPDRASLPHRTAFLAGIGAHGYPPRPQLPPPPRSLLGHITLRRYQRLSSLPSRKHATAIAAPPFTLISFPTAPLPKRASALLSTSLLGLLLRRRELERMKR